MENLETAQKLWEASIKVFDKFEDSEKKEWFNGLIDQIEDNSTIDKLKKSWNSITEEQKLKIYKKHSVTIWTWLTYGNPTFSMWATVYHWAKNLKKEWKDNAVRYAAVEQIPCRFLVQLGILDKPQWLTDDKLKEDIKKDAKNVDLRLNICEKTCLVLWEPELSGLIAIARHYTKWYKKEWTNVIIERLNKKKQNQIKEQTSRELSGAISDIKNRKKAA